MKLSSAPPAIRLHGLIPANPYSLAAEVLPRRPKRLPHPAPRPILIVVSELFLVVGLLFRWQHRVRERERQGVSVIRGVQAALFHLFFGLQADAVPLVHLHGGPRQV